MGGKRLRQKQKMGYKNYPLIFYVILLLKNQYINKYFKSQIVQLKLKLAVIPSKIRNDLLVILSEAKYQ